MAKRLYRICAIVLLVAAPGCGDPSIEGTWMGLATPEQGRGFYVRFDLNTLHTWVGGRGYVFLYDRPGIMADTMSMLSVRGFYRHPDLELRLRGDVPGMEAEEAVTYEGVFYEDEQEIVGTLRAGSRLTFRLKLERPEGL